MNFNRGKLGRSFFAVLALIFMIWGTGGCSGEQQSSNNGGNDSVPEVVVDTHSTELPDSVPPEEQIRRLTEQLKFSPENYQLYYDRSLLYYEIGNTVQAELDMEKSKEYNVTFPKAHHMLGFFAYVKNDEKMAIRHFKNAIQLGSDNPETFYMMGQIHFFQQKYKEADGYYQTAMELDSLQPIYPFARGFMAQSRGKTDEAIDWYKKSLEVYPAFLKSLTQLHDIYRDDKNDYAGALAFNDRILLVDSMHPIGRFNQGYYFLQRANKITDEAKAAEYDVLMKLAISEFGKALVTDPEFVNALYNRGYCYFMLGQYNKALQDFGEVIEKDPFNYKAFFWRGSIYEHYKDTTSAVAAFSQALKIKPDFRDAEIAVKELKGK